VINRVNPARIVTKQMDVYLKENPVKKTKNNSKGLLLILIVFLISLLVISHHFTNKGSQMRLTEMLDRGFNYGSNLSLHSYIWLSESSYV